MSWFWFAEEPCFGHGECFVLRHELVLSLLRKCYDGCQCSYYVLPCILTASFAVAE